jgi:hypothetical protein
VAVLSTDWGRRVAALPRRAKLALAAAVVLSVVAVLLLVLPGRGGGDGAGDGDAADGTGAGTPVPGHGDTSTTLATGGLEIATPEGWRAYPVPELGFGIAVPDDWEAVVLSEDGLASLANAAPLVEDFTASAHAAAASGGLIYAAGEDDQGRVSDVLVRAAPEAGVTDAAGLEDYARDLAAEAGRGDPEIEVVERAERPTVRLRFTIGGEGGQAQGTETLVLGDDGMVWSVVFTSDDARAHDDLAAEIAGTLALGQPS